MAWGMIQKPGAKYGPCKDKCEHRDCVASRREVAELCHECRKPIGYETPFANFEGNIWHNLCLDVAAEKGRL